MSGPSAHPRLPQPYRNDHHDPRYTLYRRAVTARRDLAGLGPVAETVCSRSKGLPKRNRNALRTRSRMVASLTLPAGQTESVPVALVVRDDGPSATGTDSVCPAGSVKLATI